jgi:hypothetical protein
MPGGKEASAAGRAAASSRAGSTTVTPDRSMPPSFGTDPDELRAPGLQTGDGCLGPPLGPTACS